jgi:hypothetical protein
VRRSRKISRISFRKTIASTFMSVSFPKSAAYSRHRRPEPRKGWR